MASACAGAFFFTQGDAEGEGTFGFPEEITIPTHKQGKIA
jgi:hypothetical protein